MNGFYDLVVEALKNHGFKFLRSGKGSHEIWCSNSGLIKVTVSKNCKSRMTANAIMKQAGIPKKF